MGIEEAKEKKGQRINHVNNNKSVQKPFIVSLVLTGNTYPLQQPPGLPHEFGEPQHPIGASWTEPLSGCVLWADRILSIFWLLHDLQDRLSLSPNTINSLISPQSLHLYSYMGMSSSLQYFSDHSHPDGSCTHVVYLILGGYPPSSNQYSQPPCLSGPYIPLSLMH